MPRQPTLVLVTGAPGSDKTTLSRTLAETLRLPWLSRDRFRTGLFFVRAWSDEPEAVPSREESIVVFLEAVETLLARRVSVVVDYVLLREGFPRGSRIPELAECVIVETSTPVATERYLNRLRHDPFLNRPAVLRTLGHSSIEDALAERAAGPPHSDRISSTSPTATSARSQSIRQTDTSRLSTTSSSSSSSADGGRHASAGQA